MKELQKKLKEMILKTIILGSIETVILFFFFQLQSMWIMWGTFAAVLGLIMISENIKTFLTKYKKRKFNSLFLIRYLIYGIILSIAGYYSTIGLFFSFLGLFNMKIAVIISQK